METTNHEHQHMTPSPKKSFFEKYQTFFSIIIAGALIGGGILISRHSDKAAAPAEQQGQTQDQVRKEMLDLGKDSGVNVKKMAQCLDTKAKESLISDDVALAAKSGVQGTPTFVILERTYGTDGSVKTENQFPVIGARDEATFLAAIKSGKGPAGQPPLAEGFVKTTLTDADHYLGPKNAAVTIVEYSDIDCPFCKAAKPTVNKILKDHPEYAFVYRHSPIAQLHPWATYKAQASECVSEQGGPDAFWKFMDKVVTPLATQ